MSGRGAIRLALAALMALAAGAFAPGRAAAQFDSPLMIEQPNLFANGLNQPAPFVSVKFSITNPTGRRMQYNLNLNMSGNAYDLRDQTIEPGGRRDYWVGLLSGDTYGAVLLRDGEGKARQASVNRQEAAILHVAPQAAWASAVQLNDYAARHHLVSGSGTPYYSGGTLVMSGSSGTSDPPIFQMTPEGLTASWMAYAPFRQILMEESTWAQLEPGVAQGIRHWVEGGGVLILYDAEDAAIEPVLLGRIDHVRGNPLTDAARDGGEGLSSAQWASYYGMSGFVQDGFPHNPPEKNGRGGGLALATLFFLVAGPVNQFYFKRRKRIRALLISLPVLSILFCLAMLAHFILFQGFSRKGGSYSLTLLDEAHDSGLTVAHHALLSGLYPLGGFHFGAATAFYPLQPLNNGFQMDLTGGNTLTSGLFQPSVPFHYATATPVQTREHLIYDPDKGEVTNGFATPIAGLVMRTADGRLFRAEKLEPGQPAQLTEITRSAGSISGQMTREFQTRFGGNYLSTVYVMIPPNRGDASEPKGRGSYLALFDGPRESVEPGVSISGDAQTNILYGVMEAPAS